MFKYILILSLNKYLLSDKPVVPDIRQRHRLHPPSEPRVHPIEQNPAAFLLQPLPAQAQAASVHVPQQLPPAAAEGLYMRVLFGVLCFFDVFVVLFFVEFYFAFAVKEFTA